MNTLYADADDTELLLPFLDDDLTILQEEGPNPNRQRPKITAEKLWNSSWGTMLLNPETSDPISFSGKKWITRFRVPFPVYIQIVEMCNKKNIFGIKRSKLAIPIEFRVLIALRILAKNHDSDTMCELSLVGASTCNTIFRTFVLNFRREYFREIVFMPEGEELQKVMDVYKLLGFNGCFGSIDCTHLWWNKCPSYWQNYCIGKEGYPTLAFLVVVDHNRRAMIVSRAFFGAANDKLIVKACEETKAIIEGAMEHILFHLYDGDGNLVKVQGGYLIADGGFLRIGCMMDPGHGSWSMNEVRWSEFLESIRKDVECFYGILKNRFRFCIGPIEVRDYEVVEAAFQCCTMIHNMILEFDKEFHAECSLWEDINWERLPPDISDEDIENMLEAAKENREEETSIPFLSTPESAEGAIVLTANNKLDYHKLKELLITSFTQQFQMGQVYWPTRFEGWQRDALALQRIQRRLDAECFHALYGAMSTCVGYNPATNAIDLPLGEGLFSTLSYHIDDVIAEFRGEFINHAQYMERRVARRARFILKCRNNLYLDCMENRYKGICKASLSNSPYYANKADGTQCIANCKLTISGPSNAKRLKLVACRRIEVGEEIMWSYGADHGLYN
jgi:hypothetical protein